MYFQIWKLLAAVLVPTSWANVRRYCRMTRISGTYFPYLSMGNAISCGSLAAPYSIIKKFAELTVSLHCEKFHYQKS